ncbi:MAG: AMP-binding protein [Spirochaetales bacterium]|nr:AMP-binding protein [Spirochaetales bacterium]
MSNKQFDPLLYIEPYRGKKFTGEWPTLPEMLDITVEKFSDRTAFHGFVPRERSFSYGELRDYCRQIAAYLCEKGIRKGDRVGVTGKNSPEWGIAYLSILFAGAVAVPIDYSLTRDEASGLLSRAGVKALFADGEVLDYFRNEHGSEYDIYSLVPDRGDFILDLKAQTEQNPLLPAEEDLAVILFTSGTTGVAKGVMLTHSNLVSDCYLAQGHMNLYEDDVFYALLPLHHSYTMLAVFIEGLSVGSEIIFGSSLVVSQLLKELKAGKVTMFLGVPMLFNKIIKNLMKGIREKGIVVYALIKSLMFLSGTIKKITGKNVGKAFFGGILDKVSLRTNRICISGGGPLPASTFRMYNQLGIDFVQGYGLTETSPILCLNPTYAFNVNSVGKIIPRVEGKIHEPDEEGVGEFCVKGPMVMKGYFEDPEATAAVIDEEGWFHTGDMGYLDNRNYLYLTGRAKSLIVTEGGKNVFPEEIEDKFQLYDEIEQILIRGYVLDKKMKTEGIEALIYPVQESSLDCSQERMDEIVAEVNRELKSYQKISRVTLLDEPMEMTSTKKIKRFTV